MRLPYSINKQNPTAIIHTPMKVGTVQVTNPTVSNILVATGRTDIPTVDSADYTLPSGAMVQFNATGNDFVFSFSTPGLLPDVGNTAQIALLDHTEPVGAFGSLPLATSAPSITPEIHLTAVINAGQIAGQVTMSSITITRQGLWDVGCRLTFLNTGDTIERWDLKVNGVTVDTGVSQHPSQTAGNEGAVGLYYHHLFALGDVVTCLGTWTGGTNGGTMNGTAFADFIPTPINP
jgi:hypothetical protein